MSNSFRTPILDFLRNIARSVYPYNGPDGIFSIRARRSSIRTFIQYWRYRSKVRTEGVTGVGDWVNFVSSVRPGTVGNGYWFKKWSRWMELDAKRILNTLLNQVTPNTKKEIIRSCTFLSPIQIAMEQHRAAEMTNSSSLLLQQIAITFAKFPTVYLLPSEAAGLEFQRRRLECHFPFSRWGQYQIRCDGSGREFGTYIKSKKVRTQILQHYYEVFNKSDEFHSAVLLVLRDRKRFAISQGFASWTEMQAVGNGFTREFEPLEFLHSLYKTGTPNVNQTVNKMHQASGIKSSDVDSSDESYCLNCLKSRWTRDVAAVTPLHVPSPSLEYTSVVRKVLAVTESLFCLKFEQVELSLFTHGWDKAVKAYRVIDVKDNADKYIGHIYLDLFKKRSAPGRPPHCTPLFPSNQVRIYMGLQPPFRSDVTFKKERHFTFEEITALMHEIGHAVHMLLKPQNAALAQLPMDMRETVSIMTEMYTETNEFVKQIVTDERGVALARMSKRDTFFHIDIIRNCAVAETIHSSRFDPDTATVSDLKRVTGEVYAKFCPIPPPNYLNVFGTEVVNYLLDGESRVGYLLSYVRACNSFSRDKEIGKEVFANLRAGFIENSFDPFVTNAFESKASRLLSDHPLAKHGNFVPNTADMKRFWDFSGYTEPLRAKTKSSK